MRLSELARAIADEETEVVVAQDAEVLAPRRALEVALCGLTRNARQAAAERGRSAALTLRLDASEDVATLRIEDRAGGVAPGVLGRVGEPFFTTKEPGAGMGLGVFLARSLAERLGGSLTLETEAGEGTTVTVTLPRERV